MFLEESITNLPRTRALTIQKLQSLGIKTFNDLISYYPSRHENRGSPGERISIKGILTKFQSVYTRNKMQIQKGTLENDEGAIELVWFNQRYLSRILKKGMKISVYGAVERSLIKTTLKVEDYEIVKSETEETIHTARIVPVYPETRGLSSRTIREKVWYVLHQLKDSQEIIPESLPREIVAYNHLISADESSRHIHFPDNESLLKQARERLSFEELFFLQLSSFIIKKKWQKEQVKHVFEMTPTRQKRFEEFIKKLPFSLTSSQHRALKEILTDLLKSYPMNRLLQGEVGSGKTVVCAIVSYLAYLHGYTSVIMAPTEILAQQHYTTFISLFSQYKKVVIRLVTGSHKVKPAEIKDADILIGTQALLNSNLLVKKIGFIVIDEQHRFGVRQRALLKEKGVSPHLLTMTATPIPRTVSLTLYGELDLSLMNELPKGRKSIKTYFVTKAKREAAYEWVKKLIRQNKVQVFVVCPLIEESDHDTLQTIKAATHEFERLRTLVFQDFSLGLLHGRLSSKEKETVMGDFKNKKYDILVATSVVEVGIDVPNAAVIIIEGAERFGLAQLHQLRGRVGRGAQQSYCLVFSESDDERISKRLQYFSRTADGMLLAEYDMKLRGPGSIFGTDQHGYSDLKIASLFDYPLIERVQRAVSYVTKRSPDLTLYPLLKQKMEQLSIELIAKD